MPFFGEMAILQYTWYSVFFSSVQFSRSLWPHRQQHIRLPCSSPPGACSNSCTSSWWCHLTLCRPFLLLISIFLSIRVFSNESVRCIRWPKYWSFSCISPSNEYSALISFRMDWFDLFAVQGTKANISYGINIRTNNISKLLILKYILFTFQNKTIRCSKPPLSICNNFSWSHCSHHCIRALRTWKHSLCWEERHTGS